MKNTAPLRTPTRTRSLPGVVGGDLRPELGDPLLERLLVDEHPLDALLRCRPLQHPSSLVAITIPSQPGASAMPGTATTSSPLDHERPVVARRARNLGVDEQILHLPPATGETVARTPASARRARVAPPRAATAPTRTAPSSRNSSYSRTARRPPPRSARGLPSRRGEQRGERALEPTGQHAARARRARRGSRRCGGRAPAGRDHLVADQATQRVWVGRVVA